VIKVNLSWWRKNADELKAAYRELQASKIGRKARLKGTVERIAPALDQLAAPVDRPAEAPPEGVAAAVVEPPSREIPDPRATLDRIRRESTARLERERRGAAERRRREESRKDVPIIDDDKD
jgi:hypothetical protein